jgi:hypothetical protein
MTWLQNTLPELQAAERALRADVSRRYGIVYTIREERPHYAGLRTEADTAQLLAWRNQVVATARRTAEEKRRREGGTALQIKTAGDVAASRAHYRVSPFGVGFHPIGGAFDIHIVNVGASPDVAAARRAGEERRRAQGGTAVQVKAAGDVAALDKAYQLVGARAPAFGLTWGGVFKDNPATPIVEKPDPFHLQLNQARAVVAQKFAELQQARVRAATATGGTALLVMLAVGGAAWYLATRA